MEGIIDIFSGAHAFLSNFTPCRVELDGVTYASVEHAYQAAKTLDSKQRRQIEAAVSPGQAKRLGQYVSLRPDWEQVKMSVMYDLLRQKFRQEPFRTQLLATGNAYLEEGNTWGDVCWGTMNGRGQNRLGLLLMLTRLCARDGVL